MKDIVKIASDNKTTLLGIGPMSENVIKASVQIAKEYDFPLMLIASMNQINSNGGYVRGWNQRQFVSYVRRISQKYNYKGPLFICRDHGGPWQQDSDYRANLSYEVALEKAKQLFLDDINAGFNFLHIDATKDPHFKEVPLEEVVSRTVELISFVEDERQKTGISELEYEVGTDETNGSITNPIIFEEFIKKLYSALNELRLPHPTYIVGQTGTHLKMDENIGTFNSSSAKKLSFIASKYELGLKLHNVDYLDEKILIKLSNLGVVAANVAPEFAHVETKTYCEIAEELSVLGFKDTLEKLIIKNNKHRKWLRPDQQHLSDSQILQNPLLRERIIIVNGHYFFDDENIKCILGVMHRNYQRARDRPLEEVIINAISKSITKYAKSLNLAELNKLIRG